MIEGAIFDLDGLLVDSEPLWKKAEIMAFQKTGIDLTLEMCAETTGYDSWDVIKHWYQRFPWNQNEHSFQEIHKDIDKNFTSLIETEAKIFPGVTDVLELFASKHIPMAVASSSTGMIIRRVVSLLGIGQYFKFMCSSENEALGKPYPGVYLSAIGKLGVNPLNTIAFEDSFYGLIAASAARLITVGVLNENDYSNPRFAFANYRMKSLKEFDEPFLMDLIEKTKKQ